MNKHIIIQYVFLFVLCCLFVSFFIYTSKRLHMLESSMQEVVVTTVTDSEKRLETAMDTSVGKAKNELEKRLDEKMLATQNHIENELSTAFKKDLRSTQHTIQGLQTTVAEQTKKTNTIETTFSAILDEQKKQHISTVMEDTALIEKGEKAMHLFEAEDYMKAAVLWDEIVTVQPNNLEARFYALYSRYLYNPTDSSLYAKIIREFTLLEKNGYTREEMDGVLQTIRLETAGAAE